MAQAPVTDGSRLELLPSEILVAILSCAQSRDDLYCLIRASLVVYSAFCAARQVVLTSIVAQGLGPGIRDAIAVTQIVRPDFKPTKWNETFDETIERYDAVPRGLENARHLSIDDIIALVHVNHDVQFLIDDFAAKKLPELRDVHPQAATALTTTERQRLAQAVLRHQVIACLDYNDFFWSERNRPILQKFLGLFKAWEVQQLADAHGFVVKTIYRANQHRRGPWLTTQDRFSPTEEHTRRVIKDIGLLRKDILAERERNLDGDQPPDRTIMLPGLPAFPCRFNYLIAGPQPNNTVAQQLAAQVRPVELYDREDASPALVFDEASDAPPFAWVDGHAGIDCQRWGQYLLRQPAEAPSARQSMWMRQKLNRWRHLGMMFWDRGRVELLKMRLPEYETGWLTSAPPPDEEKNVAVGRIDLEDVDAASARLEGVPTGQGNHRAGILVAGHCEESAVKRHQRAVRLEVEPRGHAASVPTYGVQLAVAEGVADDEEDEEESDDDEEVEVGVKVDFNSIEELLDDKADDELDELEDETAEELDDEAEDELDDEAEDELEDDADDELADETDNELDDEVDDERVPELELTEALLEDWLELLVEILVEEPDEELIEMLLKLEVLEELEGMVKEEKLDELVEVVTMVVLPLEGAMDVERDDEVETKELVPVETLVERLMEVEDLAELDVLDGLAAATIPRMKSNWSGKGVGARF
ncbi:hypothetical protein CMUS01_12893 [Colletotrichum musicola]|uniref:Uncharacterized protein n=1 Tax=Colletotrichum musicola TaxID=2175873 RepID=A0A8H6MXY2_9PEZI|nr:hypothetical protein CMUS01_12893 [Colletotrichum musicola]